MQSHWFAVGSLCTWARPGVGAVATQSVVEPAHGPNVLDRMERGEAAAQALAGVLAADPLAARAPGRRSSTRGASVAVHTGADCIADAGHVDRPALVCQANMMAARTVPGGDVGRVRGAPTGDLAERLMAALEGAEAEGGDVRGRQSAALLVVPAGGRAVAARDRPARRGPRGSDRRARARCSASQRAYELAGEADELMAAEPRRRGGRAATAARPSWRPTRTSCCSGPASRSRQAGDLDAGVDAVRRAIADPPGLGARCSTRLSPAFAPGRCAGR